MVDMDGAYAGMREFANVLGRFQLKGPENSKVAQAVRLRELAANVAAAFSAEDWAAVVPLVSNPSIIDDHPRLLRSLHFGDDDYGWCVQEVLKELGAADPANLEAIAAYLEGVSRRNGASSLGARVLREGESIRFRCDRDLMFVRELGHGGTGRTMLFRDETADLLFAIKKFDPMGGNDPEECYRSFVQEAVILLRLSHPNVVRVYNYYLYPQAGTGYIQMEYVDGVPIDTFLPAGPRGAGELFSDVVSAFGALESAGVLHRDVRPENVLVTPSGEVKLIDFGFGKLYEGRSTLEHNSKLLNWPYDPPAEVRVGSYDRATEVYFVGKLFEVALARWGIAIEEFPYAGVLGHMTSVNPGERIGTFAEVRSAMAPTELGPAGFEASQLSTCRAFLDSVSGALAELDSAAGPVTEADELIRRLDGLLDSCALEDVVPDPTLLLGCVVDGGYSYYPAKKPEVDIVRRFRNVMVALPQDKRRTVMRNIELRIRLVPRRVEDEIPF